jgi:SagB-type dehydrogenase family enzyme
MIDCDQLDLVLTSSCGVTGELRLRAGKVPLRAYPSPGGLYAVEVYVIALLVQGLERGVYHYSPTEQALFRVRDGWACAVSDLALPDVAHVVTGVAAFIALTAVFDRPMQKYGLGAYRTLASEAGCLAENMLLTATAIGLNAGPFTGVFDDLLNGALGIKTDEEQFLLGVLLGHSDGEK